MSGDISGDIVILESPNEGLATSFFATFFVIVYSTATNKRQKSNCSFAYTGVAAVQQNYNC